MPQDSMIHKSLDGVVLLLLLEVSDHYIQYSYEYIECTVTIEFVIMTSKIAIFRYFVSST